MTTTETLYRVQPTGRAIKGHTSRLGAEPVAGIFAFRSAETLFGTVTWLHVRKNLADYEMVRFVGRVTDCPDDSEGVVAQPITEGVRVPMTEWLAKRAA